jgi:hypothetical protein
MRLVVSIRPVVVTMALPIRLVMAVVPVMVATIIKMLIVIAVSLPMMATVMPYWKILDTVVAFQSVVAVLAGILHRGVDDKSGPFTGMMAVGFAAIRGDCRRCQQRRKEKY